MKVDTYQRRNTNCRECKQFFVIDETNKDTCPYCEINRLKDEINRLRQYDLMTTNHTVIKNDYWQNHLEEIDRLKAELESKDKAIKLLQGHCNALMDTEGKLAQWKKGHTAGQEAAGYYQKQADDIIRQLRKELSDENANFTEEIMNLERQLAEARAEVEKYKLTCVPRLLPEWQSWIENHDKDTRQEAARGCYEIARTVLVLAMKRDNFIGNAMDDLLDEINQRFGLEGGEG